MFKDMGCGAKKINPRLLKANFSFKLPDSWIKSILKIFG